MVAGHLLLGAVGHLRVAILITAPLLAWPAVARLMPTPILVVLRAELPHRTHSELPRKPGEELLGRQISMASVVASLAELFAAVLVALAGKLMTRLPV